MIEPGPVKLLRSGTLVTLIAGACTGPSTVTAAETSLTAGPDGGAPAAVATSVTNPRSTSATVVTYVAVQPRDCPGPRSAGGQSSTAPAGRPVSVSVVPVRVTLPLLASVNV